MWGDAMKVIQNYLPDATFSPPNPQTIAVQTVSVPSLGGQSVDAAAAALRKAGFTPVVGPSVNSSYASGTVAYLSPGSGSSVSTGSTVTIYVSNGTPYVAPAPTPTQPQHKGHKHGKGKGRGH
jgi:beta-lactam-binding protein with PASTA domain